MAGDLLTPKQVAQALNVSESSIKRWCDKGAIPTQYTAGGHRRIALPGLLEFLRQAKHRLVLPEAVGLPPSGGNSSLDLSGARDELTHALIAGDEPRCRQIALELYVAKHSLCTICDDVIAAAFRNIGSRWACGAAEIYQERRGCEITLRVIHELRSLLPPPPEGAPLAVGGAASGDQYALGTAMAEIVLRDAHWNATSLGDNLPFETLSAAISTLRPKLFWLSCSHIADQEEFLSGYNQLYDAYGGDVAFVVGGYALAGPLRQRMQLAAHCDNMQHLEGFAHTLSGAIVDDSAR